MSELKPCPFCGSKNIRKLAREVNGMRILCVICEHCGASGPVARTKNPRVKDDNNPAIMAWNRRAE